MIRVALPAPLRALAATGPDELLLDVPPPAGVAAVLDALEARHPALRGTIRDRDTGQRRAFIRFYACGRDLSHEPMDAPLPEAVRLGEEPLLVVGAMAGG